jgi:hypothetical protein
VVASARYLPQPLAASTIRMNADARQGQAG